MEHKNLQSLFSVATTSGAANLFKVKKIGSTSSKKEAGLKEMVAPTRGKIGVVVSPAPTDRSLQNKSVGHIGIKFNSDQS